MKKILFAIMLAIISINAKAENPVSNISKQSKVEMIFVLDTTGSMSGLIQAAKDKIWSITNTITGTTDAPEIKIGIIGYRDINDNYVTDVNAMTDDLDSLYNKLISYDARGGGDTPESVNEALYKAVTDEGWSLDTSVYKVIFLVGDAPPHMDYKNDVKYPKSAKIAKNKGIVINTILCGSANDTAKIWKEISAATGGDFFQVSASGDSTDYETPYDKKLAEQSIELEKTKVYYGNAVEMEKSRRKLEVSKEIMRKSKASAIAQRSEFNISKSGKSNFLGENEMVESVSKGKIKIEDVKTKELPPEMQKMSLAEKKQFIADKQKARKEITQKIKNLSEERQAYIKEMIKKKKENSKDSFDYKVSNSLRKQAKSKGIKISDEMKY